MKEITNIEEIREKLLKFVNADYLGVIYLESLINAIYKESTDDSHKSSHIFEVLTRAMAIKNDVLTTNEILAIAFHDIANHLDRDFHEVLGVYWFNVIAKGILKNQDIHIIEKAIRNHRASYQGELTTYIEALVSSADRPAPGDVSAIVERSYKYARNQCNTKMNSVMHAVNHVKEKYGTNGYSKFPDLYKEFYGEQLEKMRIEVDVMSCADYLYLAKLKY
ncbi:MAG: hypothetical protein ACRCYT_02310 [Cetobacterium sp.]